MKGNDKAALSRILADMQKIQRYMEGCGQESFFDNEEKQDAVIMVLLTIGERVRRGLSIEFQKAHDYSNSPKHGVLGIMTGM